MPELWILDYDRTMFMSDDHSHALLELGLEHGHFDPERAAYLREQMFNEHNTVDTSAIFEEEGVNPSDIFDLVAEAGESHLYPDVLPFIRGVDNFHVVTTATDLEEQAAKLRLGGVEDRATILDGQVKGEYIRDQIEVVEDGLIFPDHHDKLIYDRIAVVDDRIEMIEALLDIAGVRVILIQRSDAKYVPESPIDNRVEVIKSFEDIVFEDAA
jgi:hypothetical protein